MGRGLRRPRLVLRGLLVPLRQCRRDFVSPIHNNKPATRSEVVMHLLRMAQYIRQAPFQLGSSFSRVAGVPVMATFGNGNVPLFLMASISSVVSGGLSLSNRTVLSSTARRFGFPLRTEGPSSSTAGSRRRFFGPPDCELIPIPPVGSKIRPRLCLQSL